MNLPLCRLNTTCPRALAIRGDVVRKLYDPRADGATTMRSTALRTTKEDPFGLVKDLSKYVSASNDCKVNGVLLKIQKSREARRWDGREKDRGQGHFCVLLPAVRAWSPPYWPLSGDA